jgi:hypothetical protein
VEKLRAILIKTTIKIGLTDSAKHYAEIEHVHDYKRAVKRFRKWERIAHKSIPNSNQQRRAEVLAEINKYGTVTKGQHPYVNKWGDTPQTRNDESLLLLITRFFEIADMVYQDKATNRAEDQLIPEALEDFYELMAEGVGGHGEIDPVAVKKEIETIIADSFRESRESSAEMLNGLGGRVWENMHVGQFTKKGLN